MKQVITLEDGSFVEINGTNVRHVKENGQIWYDSTNRILSGQEQIDSLRKKLLGNQEEKRVHEEGAHPISIVSQFVGNEL